MEKINCSGLEKNRARMCKKRTRAANPWYVSNNAKLLTNSGESGKRFILFKLFLPKSKSLNLGFLLKN